MRVGIVGATGAVGQELIRVLQLRKDTLPVKSLYLFASERSKGKIIVDDYFGIMQMDVFSIEIAKSLDIVFFAVSGSFAKEYAKALAKEGPIVIDNSSALRLDPEVPLVIPEINPETIGDSNLVANPNCTTAIAALPLWGIHECCKIKRVLMSTYQAASGAGAEGMKELRLGTKEYMLNLDKKTPDREITHKVFTHSLAFNVIPHIDAVQENEYTREEMKVVWETRKIFGLKDLPVSCTAVRIPTFRAHAEAVTVEVEEPLDIEKIKAYLEKMPGVKVVDDVRNNQYPMPLTATKSFDVEVGRIRKNIAFENALDFFVCGDQLLRGAALNAVLIAEHIYKERRNKKQKTSE